jgi:putative ABC transport system permease protein
VIGAGALSVGDVAMAALLLLANGLISIAFRLGLERGMVVAGLRMVLQLAAVGYVLQVVFRQSSAVWTMSLALLMVAVAAHEACARQSLPIAKPASLALSAGTLLLVGSFTAMYVTSAVLRVEPWYSARVFLPILGMILGNALTGMALAFETLTQTASSGRGGLEARLALGHPRFEAMREPIRRALTTAMMPVINSMTVAGVVALPGMMTGQILAGVEPIEAAKYQIMIMFAIAGASSLAVAAAAVGGVLLITDRRGRLRLDRLSRKTPD